MSKFSSITCMCLTYGRFSTLRESLSCFLNQTYPAEFRELLILNLHTIPIQCNYPNVRVLNCPDAANYSNGGSLLNARLIALQEARSDFVTWWDDDDLFLPWNISQRMRHAKESPITKSTRFWFTEGLTVEGSKVKASLEGNVAECSWTVLRDWINFNDYQSHGDVCACWPLGWLDKALITDFDFLSSYVYRWNNGVHHFSGLPSSIPIRDRVEWYQQQHTDVREDEELTPINIDCLWEKFCSAVELKNVERANELRKHFLLSLD